jgi:hypothetical protein
LKNPGAGAVEFARKYVKMLTREEAKPIIERLCRGELHNSADKRVKRCAYCGYYWRDESLRNTRKTCSDECKRGIKTLQKREQRAQKELLNPGMKQKKSRIIDDYIWWIEYPFWLNEYSLIKYGWKYEKPTGLSVIDYIEAKNEIYGKGNRRKPKEFVDYHGDNRDQF